MSEPDENESSRDAEAARRAAVAVELISHELERRPRSWSALRLLAARLLQITDAMENGTALDGDSR